MKLSEIKEKKRLNIEDIKNYIYDLIVTRICDYTIKQALLYIYEPSPIPGNLLKWVYIYVWQSIVLIFENIQIKDLSWDLIVKCYYVNPVEFLVVKGKDIDLLRCDWFERTEKNRGAFVLFDKIVKLYTHLSDNKTLIEENIIEISEYKHMFIPRSYNEATHSNRDFYYENSLSEFISKYICTNFPYETSYKRLLSCKIISPTGNTVYYNYNINTENVFIKYILGEFISCYDDIIGIQNTPFRIFLYYFSDSLGKEKTFINLKDFTIKVFKSQYDYYRKLQEEYKDYMANKGKNFEYCIVNFYRFLVSFARDKYNTSILEDEAFEQALVSRYFLRYFSQGYIFVFHNPFSNYPEGDKWYVIKSLSSRDKSASIDNNMTNYAIGFWDIDIKYREHVKNYIWHGRGSLPSRYGYLNRIKDFLNFKERYDSSRSNVVNIDKYNIEFTEEMIVLYKEYLKSKEISIKNTLSAIRLFIIHISKKFDISQKIIDLLSTKMQKQYSGGTIITENDYCLIRKRFEELQSVHSDGELMYIVFFIFATTNIRIGEILNFRRDCIVNDEQYNDGSATILFYSKTDKSKMKKKKLSPDVINMLKRAIEITGPILKKDKISEYIFIKRFTTANIEKNIRINFKSYFHSYVIEPLKDKLEIIYYRPYNMRHTFIDRAFKDGIENDMDINDIRGITDNSIPVACKHYIEKLKVELYVEVISQVTISDVDIEGNILLDESEAPYSTSPVKQDLGVCDLKECMFDLAECLRCNHFYTFVSRIPMFERYIRGLNRKISRCIESDDAEQYISEKELCAAFLKKMLQMDECN